MSYYGAGDYYGAGGLGSFLGGIVKGAAGAVGGFLRGGPVGAVTGAVSSIATPSSARPTISFPSSGIGINPGAMLPGGKPFITTRKRYRRMNYTNVKALRRADRRIDGFVKEARKALKHTNYTLVSKSARKSSKRGGSPIIVETGPGGVRA